MKLRHAKRIDFTGQVEGFDKFDAFSPAVMELIRSGGRSDVAIVVDYAYGFAHGYTQPHLVVDHLNLTGDNPLVGPNDPIGPRFPVVNDIYVSAADTMDQEETWAMGNPLGKMRNAIIAGIKNGIKLSDEEVKALQRLGAPMYCYNLVPTMIVAAHAGLKVLGLVVPEGQQLDRDTVNALCR